MRFRAVTALRSVLSEVSPDCGERARKAEEEEGRVSRYESSRTVCIVLILGETRGRRREAEEAAQEGTTGRDFNVSGRCGVGERFVEFVGKNESWLGGWGRGKRVVEPRLTESNSTT
eukprot:3833489-Rhodomonas_salina.1